MEKRNLRLEFFTGKHSDTSVDAFTHWVQSEYDTLQSQLSDKDKLIGECKDAFTDISKGQLQCSDGYLESIAKNLLAKLTSEN